MAVAWLLIMDAAGGGWTTVSRCVGKGGGRGGSLGMRWGGVGACWNGWRTHAVGGFFGAVGPSALALSPTFWFLGGWPCAPPLLLPPYPPLSSTEVAPRPVPPARGVPNRGTGVTAATSVPLRPPLLYCDPLASLPLSRGLEDRSAVRLWSYEPRRSACSFLLRLSVLRFVLVGPA